MREHRARVLLNTIAALFVSSSTGLVISPRRLGPSLLSKSYDSKEHDRIRHMPLTVDRPAVKMALDVPFTVIKVGVAVGAVYGVATVLRRRGGGRQSTEAEDMRRYNEVRRATCTQT
jgi:hypothetical protein